MPAWARMYVFIYHYNSKYLILNFEDFVLNVNFDISWKRWFIFAESNSSDLFMKCYFNIGYNEKYESNNVFPQLMRNSITVII